MSEAIHKGTRPVVFEQAHQAIHATAATSVGAAVVSVVAGTHTAAGWLEGAASTTLVLVQWAAAAVAIIAGIVSIVLAVKRNDMERRRWRR